MDLLISTNAAGTQAVVERAIPGELRGDAFIVRPGETVLDVPYDAWLRRVGETVDPRELHPARPEPEQGLWSTPLGPIASAVLYLSMTVMYVQEDLKDPGRTPLEAAWLLLICAAWSTFFLKNVLGLSLPGWVRSALFSAFASLAGVTFYLVFR
jgi:hypothetical protein